MMRQRDITDFYIDDIAISREVTSVVRGDIPAIKDVYKIISQLSGYGSRSSGESTGIDKGPV